MIVAGRLRRAIAGGADGDGDGAGPVNVGVIAASIVDDPAFLAREALVSLLRWTFVGKDDPWSPDALDDIGPDRSLVVYYEDLVLDFIGEVRRMNDFLGLTSLSESRARGETTGGEDDRRRRRRRCCWRRYRWTRRDCVACRLRRQGHRCHCHRRWKRTAVTTRDILDRGAVRKLGVIEVFSAINGYLETLSYLLIMVNAAVNPSLPDSE